MPGLGLEDQPAAGVAELVDALDLGSSDESRGGSNPSARTMLKAWYDFQEVGQAWRYKLGRGGPWTYDENLN
jgi:hypothetical protein